MKKHLLCATLSLASVGLCTHVMARNDHTSSWSYSADTGPQHWGELKSDYTLCSTGLTQSPIDIGDAVKADLSPLTFSYRASSATVLNNGHTIQVSPVDAGGITLATGDYSLVQLHFHTPSEEKIQGRTYPLNVHFVHRNAAGELAVVALLFEEGAYNPALEPILAIMPKEAGGMTKLSVQNIADLLPATRHYFSYMGSLTTPPCSEGVRWHVLTQPVQLSKDQLQAFQALYPMNARPVQPLNGRTVQVGG
ncbi:carbonic anhydrase [Pseudomonas sp. C2B4]|uniref:carbonic anhydrase n=1 Tax=Pseudomonas sp. C2B4 TaxID=2735270 RepID=UPI001586918C|nr:carbonic anhydrase family protein [Pseudomonas sp. C2B4]NUU37959.1 carbonic anhydrase family protein [Pseudomonas sp. C2B4]